MCFKLTFKTQPIGTSERGEKMETGWGSLGVAVCTLDSSIIQVSQQYIKVELRVKQTPPEDFT